MESRRAVAAQPTRKWPEVDLDSIEDGLDFGNTPLPEHIRAALTAEHVDDLLLSLQGASLMMMDDPLSTLVTAAVTVETPPPAVPRPAPRPDPIPVRPVLPAPSAPPAVVAVVAPAPPAAPRAWTVSPALTLAVLALSIPFGLVAFAGGAALVFMFL